MTYGFLQAFGTHPDTDQNDAHYVISLTRKGKGDGSLTPRDAVRLVQALLKLLHVIGGEQCRTTRDKLADLPCRTNGIGDATGWVGVLGLVGLGWAGLGQSVGRGGTKETASNAVEKTGLYALFGKTFKSYNMMTHGWSEGAHQHCRTNTRPPRVQLVPCPSFTRTLMYVAPMLSHNLRKTDGGLFRRVSTGPVPSRTPPKTFRATSIAVVAVALICNSMSLRSQQAP